MTILSADDAHDLGLCPDCDADLTIPGTAHAPGCPLVVIEPDADPLPRASLHWLVGGLHVSVSDDAIAADVTARATGPGWTPALVAAAIAYAIACHHENQETYRTVTGSL